MKGFFILVLVSFGAVLVASNIVFAKGPNITATIDPIPNVAESMVTSLTITSTDEHEFTINKVMVNNHCELGTDTITTNNLNRVFEFGSVEVRYIDITECGKPMNVEISTSLGNSSFDFK